MNRERAKELLPIIEALANGEEIQYRVEADKQCGSDSWTDIPSTGISLQSHVEYRIKPKPREFYVQDPEQRMGQPLHWGILERDKYIKVREVL